MGRSVPSGRLLSLTSSTLPMADLHPAPGQGGPTRPPCYVVSEIQSSRHMRLLSLLCPLSSPAQECGFIAEVVDNFFHYGSHSEERLGPVLQQVGGGAAVAAAGRLRTHCTNCSAAGIAYAIERAHHL